MSDHKDPSYAELIADSDSWDRDALLTRLKDIAALAEQEHANAVIWKAVADTRQARIQILERTVDFLENVADQCVQREKARNDAVEPLVPKVVN